MEIGPILSTLKRHKITASLVVLEIALSCAIVCNAVFLVTQRIERMQMPSGVAEHELVQVQAASIGERTDSRARVQEDLAALRRIPGVSAATLVNQIPFGRSSWNSGIKLDPEQNQPTLNATSYYGEDIPQTFGLNLIAGRSFTPGEYVDLEDVLGNPDFDFPHVAILTRQLGEKLWPGEAALGKEFYLDKDRMRVVGVVDGLVRPSLANGDATAHWSILYDRIRADINALAEKYVIREIAFDRWNATQLATQLQGDGFPMIGFGQGFASMSGPAKELERRVLGKELNHAGNAVLRWMASNVTVTQDPAGNIKPDKAKSTERIDGIVAACMAIGRYMVAEDTQPDPYASRGLIFV